MTADPYIEEGNAGGAPRTSVVVASCRATSLLEACLASLVPQCQSCRAEIIVARNVTEPELDLLRQGYPKVRFLAVPASRSIPLLRAAGLKAARGAVIACTEDHCVAASDWLQQLLRASREGFDVVGGAMDNAQRHRAVDWAAYFSEYGFFAQNGGTNAQAPLLTGANVAYARHVLEDVFRYAARGEWENVIHAHLAGAGRRLRFAPEAVIFQNQNYGFVEFCRDRYRHGYDYARRRLVDEAPRRWLYMLGSPALPLLQAARLARAMGRHQRWAFLRASPITVALLGAWSLGEAIGYWHGEPAHLGETNA